MDAGLSRYLGDHIPYDHADDVRLAYSTGGRLDKGDEFITYGVFPDVPLAEKQNEFLQNSDYANVNGLLALFDAPGQNDSFSNVNVAHMERINANLNSGPDPINATSA